MKSKLEKVKLKADIIQKSASHLPSFNIKIEDVLEVSNVKYDINSSNTLDIYYKENLKSSFVIVYIHGGGWCSYDKSFYKSPLKKIANMNTVVFNCNYGLAPAYMVEDMEHDIFKILDFVKNNAKYYGGDYKKIIMMGDSAGAHLVSLFVSKINSLKYSDNSYKDNIVGLGLFYGVYDLTTVRDSKFTNIDVFINSISDGNIETDKILSPVSYINKFLPPIFITSGAIDKLHSQSEAYYKLLVENNIEVYKLFFKKQEISARHSFLNLSKSKACQQSLEVFHEFLMNLNKK